MCLVKFGSLSYPKHSLGLYPGRHLADFLMKFARSLIYCRRAQVLPYAQYPLTGETSVTQSARSSATKISLMENVGRAVITREMVEAEKKRMTPASAKKVLIELGLITKSGNPTARFR